MHASSSLSLSFRRLTLSALVAGLALGAPLVLAGEDPIVGTWKMNAAKSKFSPAPGLKTLTVSFAAEGPALKVVSDLVDAEGKASHNEYTASYDGKEYPIKGSETTDTVTLKKIDASTSERTDKKGGKVVGTFLRTVSSDGKTMTVVQTTTDAKGQPVKNTLVLEKQ